MHLTACLQSPMRQMHDHVNFKLQISQFIDKLYGLIHTCNIVFFYNFRNRQKSSSCKFRQRKLNTHKKCGPVAATLGLFNDMRQYINKHCFLQVLYTFPLSTSCVPLLIYIVMDCNMHLVFSLRVFELVLSSD